MQICFYIVVENLLKFISANIINVLLAVVQEKSFNHDPWQQGALMAQIYLTFLVEIYL